MTKRGEMTPGKMAGGVPVPIGKPDFWIFGCPCGYNEINDVGTQNYRRDYLEGLKMMEEQINVKKD